MREAVVRGLTLPVAIVLVWAVVAHAGWVNARILVAPDRVLLAPFRDTDAAYLWAGLGASLARMAIGFTAGVTLGPQRQLLGTTPFGGLDDIGVLFEVKTE